MLTGNEYIFENVDEALKYVQELEQRELASDLYRRQPASIVRLVQGMFSQPFTEGMAQKAIVPVDSLAAEQHGAQRGFDLIP